MNSKPLILFILFSLIFSVSWERYSDFRKYSTNNISDYVEGFIGSYNDINTPEINIIAYSLALKGVEKISDKLQNDTVLTIIDYSLPSTEKRLFVLDIKNNKLLLNLYVAHGKNTGINYAESFSNRKGSNMSCLGFFVTKNTYMGKHGYSLRLDGLEMSNNNALERAIVIHGAYYVTPLFIEEQGRLGRSFGCPAVPYDDSKNLIDIIKDGSCVFAYFPSEDYLSHSKILMLAQNDTNK